MNNSYGFLESMPPDAQVETEVNACSNDCVAWFTTHEVEGAVNHCASVMAANIQLCFDSQNGRRPDVLTESYNTIGDGPVLRGAYRTARFLNTRGLRVHLKPAVSVRCIMRQLRQGRPCALLVHGHSMSAWHWVAAIGYVLTTAGGVYLKIANGWHASPYYFQNGHGSWIVYAAAFQPARKDARQQ